MVTSGGPKKNPSDDENLVFVVMGFEPTALTFECQPETRPTKSRQLLVDSRVYKSICSHLMNSYEYSEGSKSKKESEVAAGGFEPATSRLQQIPAHLRIASPPREARPYVRNPCYMNSSSYKGEGGELKTREKTSIGTARDADDAARRTTTQQRQITSRLVGIEETESEGAVFNMNAGFL